MPKGSNKYSTQCSELLPTPIAFKLQRSKVARSSKGIENGLESCRRKLEAAEGKVKEQWGELTDDDLDEIDGRREQLEGKIQERYGIARDQVRRDIDDWYGRQNW
jgi:uncharacterized protein YjbJ (UPF0337 family)